MATIHERDGWRWVNLCPVCGKEAMLELDDGLDLWWCENGHHADYPNPVEVPAGVANWPETT